MELKKENTDNIALIDNLRYILLIGVILIHCNIVLIGVPDTAGIAADIIRFISSWLCSACVPFYFLISGYLMFLGIERFSLHWYLGKLRRRIWSLLLPYLIWNLLGLTCFFVKLYVSSGGSFLRYDGIGITMPDIIKGFWSMELIADTLSPYPYDFVLWFIRDLIVLSLFAPVFYIVAKYAGWIILGSLILLATVGVDLHLPVSGVLFFYAGALLSIKKINFGTLPLLGNWLVPPAAMFAIMPSFIDFPATVNPAILYIMTAIPALSAIVQWLITRHFCIGSQFMASGFFIYAFHGLYVTIAAKFSMSVISPGAPLSCLACYMLDFCIIFSTATAAYFTCRRFFPKLTAILTGSRTMLGNYR